MVKSGLEKKYFEIPRARSEFLLPRKAKLAWLKGACGISK